MNRRGFLKTVAAASPLILAGRAFAQGAVSPNEMVNVGVVGLGGRARQIRESVGFTDGIRIVAASDCFEPRLNEWMASNPEGETCTPYLDFREMIEKENLDAVLVETTTHARAWVSCHAMAMGCDVYIEKPMSLTIAEGREMVNCARKYGRVTQIGTQQRSIPLNNWASALVRNGRIGKLRTVYAPNFLGPVAWPTDRVEEPFPEGSNEGWWDIWTNQAPLRPYHHLMHRQWDHYAEFDGGGQSFGVTGWGAHSFDEAQKGMGTDETGPVEIILEEPLRDKVPGIYPEGREPAESETGAHYYQMIRNRPPGPRAVVRMRYAAGHELALTLDSDWGPGLGAIFVGDDGVIEINRDEISASDPEIISGDDRPSQLPNLYTNHENVPHLADFRDCIKSRERCNGDIEYGQRASTVCYLVNIARDAGHIGMPLKWDPETEQFTNFTELNNSPYMTRTRRAGYELPA